MRTIYLLLFCVVVALSSCSSAYKSGQTPDDVYYSPGNQRTAVSNNSNSNTQDEYYDANPNDQYLMMRVQDPNRWSTFDNYDYGFAGSAYPYSYGTYGLYGGYSPFMTFGYWNPYYSYFNNYYTWNNFYNPYYYGGSVIVVGSKYPGYYGGYSQLRPFSTAAYTTRSINSSNTRTAARFYAPASRSSLMGNSSRRFNNQNMNNNSYRPQQQNFQPTRSYTPSSSFGGSGGGRSFSRPGKG